MPARRFISLASAFAGDELPTEFRLFVAGWNDTENGKYLFDAEAASSVMDAYRKWGVDLAIDLEHQMLEPEIAPDPTAKDARGWCKLELRPDGSLWAVDVKWTADGRERLTQKRQRYVSPAFSIDPETSRVIAMINIAITAIPATHDTPALVAASRPAAQLPSANNKKRTAMLAVSGGNGMTLEEFAKVCKALGLDPSMTLEDAMAKIKGEAPADPEDAPPPAGDGGADEPMEMNAAPAADAEKSDKTGEVAASVTRLMRLTGAKSFVDAVGVVDTFRASHLELETERQKLAAERKTLENAERRKLCVDLVSAAGRAPATVWADPLNKNSAPKAYLAAMPIEDFRALVADEISAKGGTTVLASKRPPAGSANASGLTAEELAICASMKCEPAAYAALKNQRDGVTSGGK